MVKERMVDETSEQRIARAAVYMEASREEFAALAAIAMQRLGDRPLGSELVGPLARWRKRR